MDRLWGSLCVAVVLVLACLSGAQAQQAPDPEAHVPTSELPPPFTVGVELDARYASASTATSTSDAFVTRLVARWIVVQLLELRLDWGLAHVAYDRRDDGASKSSPELADTDVVVLGNPALSFGLFLTDQSRPYAGGGITVEMILGVSLPVSPAQAGLANDCARCNLAAMSNGGLQRWIWMPETLAAWITMAIRRGEPDSWFFGFDLTGSAMVSVTHDEVGAWGGEGGMDFGWSLLGDLVALGVRVQGVFAGSDHEPLALGSVVPFVELELFDRAFVRADATIDLYSFEGAPWSTGVRAGVVF